MCDDPAVDGAEVVAGGAGVTGGAEELLLLLLLASVEVGAGAVEGLG
jgi:hypothetical protein